MFVRSNSTIMYLGQSIHQRFFYPEPPVDLPKTHEWDFTMASYTFDIRNLLPDRELEPFLKPLTLPKGDRIDYKYCTCTCIRTYIIRYQKKNRT